MISLVVSFVAGFLAGFLNVGANLLMLDILLEILHEERIEMQSEFHLRATIVPIWIFVIIFHSGESFNFK